MAHWRGAKIMNIPKAEGPVDRRRNVPKEVHRSCTYEVSKSYSAEDTQKCMQFAVCFRIYTQGVEGQG